MDGPTHTWIAIRAVALLESTKEVPNLVNLLKPNLIKASVGAWIPDQNDTKRGDAGSKTENHVLKIEPYTQTYQQDRFILKKDRLLNLIGEHRKTAVFLKKDATLDDIWWETPYKGDVPKPGQHLPNRIMALSTMLKDLLLMGDQETDQLTFQTGKYKAFMDAEVQTNREAAAMYFFMLSHFVADICMPCHCDARKLANYKAGLHMKLEEHWSQEIGNQFEKANLNSLQDTEDNNNQLLEDAKKIDDNFSLEFILSTIPDIHPKQDEWSESIYLCRASFSIASIIAPYQIYKYNDKHARAPFEIVFGSENSDILKEIDAIILHDAVLNTAIFWKHIWKHISKN